MKKALENDRLTTLHLTAPIDEDEARMRRALDVGSHEGGRSRQDHSHGSRPLRQFAQDGDVPVVRLAGRKDGGTHAASARLEELLAAERGLREQAEVALKQANATIQALHTKIAHAEIAHAEALNAGTRLFEAKLLELQAELAAAQAVPAAVPAAEPKRAKPQPAPVRVAEKRAEHAGDEPEPIQWWVPGWREGLGRGR